MVVLIIAFNPLFPAMGPLQALNQALPVVIRLLGPFALRYSWQRVEKHEVIKKRRLSAREYYEFDASLGNLQSLAQ